MNKQLTISSLLLASCFALPINAAEVDHTYNINYINDAPVLNGQGVDKAWEKANPLIDFTFPWRADPAPATEFRALWNDKAIYFRYVVADNNLSIGRSAERGVLDSDRVELFLAKDPQLSTYYTLEIDAQAQAYSAIASYSVNLKKRTSLVDSWDWGSVEKYASVTANGYIVEAKIPLDKISELGLWQNNEKTQLLCALMRAEFTPLEDGSIDMGWMTWVDPKTAKPNFHNPGTFGKCNLVK